MQTKQIVGGLIAIGLPLGAVWMMMQPPGGGAPTPAKTPAASPATPQQPTAPAQPANKAAATNTAAVLAAPVPQPKAHGKAEKSPVSAVTAAVGDEYALFFTANGLGEYDDCGCRQRPLGGVARRMKWLKDRVKEKRFKSWLAADAGGLMTADAAGAIPPAEELSSLADAFFKTHKLMKYAAINVGIQDLAMGHEALKKAADKHKLTLVSANVIDKASSEPYFAPHTIAEAGKIKMGLFGLLSAKAPARKKWVDDKGLTIADPVTTAKEQVKQLRAKGCQLIVALSQLSDEEKDDIGEKVPGVDIVIGSLKQDLTHRRPESLGRGFFADPYHKGKWVGEWIIRPGTDQSRWHVVDLREKLQTEQVSLERQINYYAREFKADDDKKAKGEAPKMNERERKFAEERYAGVRAKLARVKLELQDDIDVPKGGSTLQMNMYPMRADELADDPEGRKIIDAHKKVYPPPPKSH